MALSATGSACSRNPLSGPIILFKINNIYLCLLLKYIIIFIKFYQILFTSMVLTDYSTVFLFLKVLLSRCQ